VTTIEERLDALESTCRTLSAKVRALEAPGRRVPETRNTESIRYDRYGREERHPITKRGFNEPL
jgi:hypothetical protein